MALPGALPIPNPCPVFAGSDGEPSTASSSCTWKNTGPDRDCVSKSPTRTRRSAVSCSSDLGCLGSREAGGPPACPPAQRGSGPQCLRPAFLPGLGPPCARLRPAVRCCPSPSASPASARLATFLLLPSLCRHVPRLCVPGAPPSHPGSCPLWPFVEGTGVLFNHWAQPLLPSPRPALGTVSDCVWGRSDVPDTRRQ